MPDDDSTPIVPIPLGVLETGGFAGGIDSATIQQLKPQDVYGTVPKDIIKAKGESDDAHFGLVGGEMDANDLKIAGWAVMFGATVDQKIKTNLSPLIEHRRQQVGDPTLFKTLVPPPSAGQTASDWLLTQHTSLDVVDPAKGVPYYVLIVASPEEISFEFQYELDLYWGVGRLWFENADDFERYAQSVVDYETASQVPSSRKLVFFAPDYGGADNGASKELCDSLVNPLISAGLGQNKKFKLQSYVGATATKSKLNDILTASDPDGTPALLFTGSHGLMVAPDKAWLADFQGAIMCQEWNGQPPLPDTYYAAQDLPQNAKVHGMVHFMFDCYGLGWPENDTYSYQHPKISPKPMMARLPQALLGRENGALAVLGHIDRAWSYSYQADGHQPQDQSFKDVLTKLMGGYRFGNATDQFNLRWAALTIQLAATRQKMQTTRGLEKQALYQWIARDDARNYILHGDPAIRLRVEAMPPLGSVGTG